jgi:Phage-related lysozyme (muraminidase)
MENRFLEVDETLPQISKNGSNGHARQKIELLSSESSRWVEPLSARDRVLVVLVENGGIDLNLSGLVNALWPFLPGTSLLPNSLRSTLTEFLERKIKSYTDNLLESAELALNRYTAAKPDLFSDVITLRDGTATYADLKNTLISQSRNGKIIDLFILTHGWRDLISAQDNIDGAKIRNMKTEYGRPLSIRSVYMMNCIGSSLNQAWLDAGAKASCGSVETNYLPEPTMFFFWNNWKNGQTFESAATSAYRRTINLMNAAAQALLDLLPAPARALAGSIDFENMDFVRKSAPLIQGQRTLTISTDNLSFSQTISSSLATTVLPVSLLRSLALSEPDAGATRTRRTLSTSGVDLIKRFESFRANLCNDAAGHCTIGYGTLVHKGRCDGRDSEAPYTNGVTQERATNLLTQRAEEFGRTVNDAVTVELNQNQFDALVSFVYNIGSGSFQSSTLLRVLNQGNYAAVPTEIKKWTKAHANSRLVELPGLVTRREAEAQLFQTPPSTAQSFSSDIPLDPGTGGRSIDENALQMGDIIVSTTSHVQSRLIRWATQSQVSHTMIYIGGGQVVEAVGEGVMLHSLREALNDATVAVAFRYPGLTSTQALMVRDFAGQQLGRPYNYWGIVRQGGFQLDRLVFCSGRTGAAYDSCVNWVGRVNLGRGSDDSFFCSQLVLAAYQHAGVPLTNSMPHWNSPDDLAQLGLSRRLGYVGHLKAPPVRSLSLTYDDADIGLPQTRITQTYASPFSFTATEWASLISFRPPVSVQTAVKGKGIHWHVHRIEDAYGDINLDYYPVTVTRLPTVAGRMLTAEELLSHVRLNLNRFVDTNNSEFAPYDSGEARTWSSSSPLGSVVHIDMKAAGGWINVDDGSVVVSEYAADHWIFSTIWTVLDQAHPVSGNRRFGFTREGTSYTFYTRGADRCTGLLDTAAMAIVFSAAHNLWLSLQRGIASFITSSGGSASVGTATSVRTPWSSIQPTYHHPTVGWV